MKKLLFAVSALAALALLAPSTGFAQNPHQYDNQVGLFMNADGTGETGTNVIGSGVFVYMVLLNPVDDQNASTPYPDINAFECSLFFDPVPNNNLFLLQTALPEGSVDIGPSKDINSGRLDFIVGISDGQEVPVVDGSVTLATFNFMNLSAGTFDVSMGPSPAPGIPDQMVYQSETGQLRIMYQASGEAGGPVFQFNGSAVAVENESFGSVKALFR